ncbi:lipopolysaccharide export system permease protein [Gelidibacter sediminis]|uniref:Lipopolysaccharide export system permease protein n=1 Tax=Gelidibacter sediminis TaxID=1608710 RepID=A0A4R7Q0Y2_9FLAO|nr:LptF/LptG family permease [Gelidibacter sediminis]TDU40402.1 lipopolysaccharide export system permease protein [Gelidibacter sediminis]
MKILDRYILKTYLKTFLSVFVILMLIFVLQAVWLYISELAGKDLDVDVIFKFLLYITPTLIPLILPLTILLVSIMVFGSFAENYEFAAMKSTGISLQRAMRGLSIFIVLLSVTTFLFANNVIPWAEYNAYNLRKNIAKVKPQMAIAEGQFNELGNFNIKVDKKSGDRGQFLSNVIMHQSKVTRPGNYTVIIAESGELKSSPTSNILQLVLFNGNYYEEIFSKKPKEIENKPHAKSYFETYTMNVDLEALNDVDLDDKSYTSRYNMLDVAGLNYTIDSLYNNKSVEYKNFAETLYGRTSVGTINSNLISERNIIPENSTPVEDSISSVDAFKGNITDLYDLKTKLQLTNLALNTVNSTTQIIETKQQFLQVSEKNLNKHLIALHEKYVLGFACFILFFVGAPLGALIRKGGIGLPLVIAILLFLTYHFIGIFAKNSAEDGTLNPILATWLSTLIMLPLGVYLTTRATNDKGLFDFDSYLNPIKSFLNLRPKNSVIVDGELVQYSFLDGYNTEKLIQVIKNHDALDFDESVKPFALNQLLKRNQSIEDLRHQGVVIEDAYLQLRKEATDSIAYSKFAVIFYAVGLLLIGLHFIFKNNGLPETAASARDLGFISLLVYLFYYVITFLKSKVFYKHLKVNVKPLNPFLMLIGLPFYGVSHFLLKNKIKEDLDRSAILNVK